MSIAISNAATTSMSAATNHVATTTTTTTINASRLLQSVAAPSTRKWCLI